LYEVVGLGLRALGLEFVWLSILLRELLLLGLRRMVCAVSILARVTAVLGVLLHLQFLQEVITAHRGGEVLTLATLGRLCSGRGARGGGTCIRVVFLSTAQDFLELEVFQVLFHCVLDIRGRNWRHGTDSTG